ncbi:MAG TPA: hypothetical protein VGS58_15765 [Candidatus Sulfopaludibacter sp.]|nr:hypothetical protein [Candidatus Sulfopaludibacter sp.]
MVVRVAGFNSFVCHEGKRPLGCSFKNHVVPERFGMDASVGQERQEPASAAERDTEQGSELGAARCPVCDGSGRLKMALPVLGNDDCPACWGVGVVAAEVAPYLLRRKAQAPVLRLPRKQAS